MQWLFTAPIARAGIDGGQTLSGVQFERVNFDVTNPANIVASVVVYAIEDQGPAPGRARTIVVTPSQTLNQVNAALKAQAAAVFGVAFQ